MRSLTTPLLFLLLASAWVPTTEATEPGTPTQDCLRQVASYVANTQQKGRAIAKERIDRAEKLCDTGDTRRALSALRTPAPKAPDAAPQTPPAAANIFRFSASPATVRRGASTSLSWDVYNAEQVRLDDTDVQARGRQTVAPQRTTTYHLKAWAADAKVEERVTVHVSPFPRPTLPSPFKSLEICREVDKSGTHFRCIGPDGPFSRGAKVHLIVRFDSLPSGQHRLQRILHDGGRHGNRWQRIHAEESGFGGSRDGYAEAALEVANKVDGFTKLELVLDGDGQHKAEIIYCVGACRGYDEW